MSFLPEGEVIIESSITDLAGNTGGHNSSVLIKGAIYSAFTSNKIALGGNHSCAITLEGAVKCWGWGRHGQLGNKQVNDIGHPVFVHAGESGTNHLDNIIQLEAGDAIHVLLLRVER